MPLKGLASQRNPDKAHQACIATKPYGCCYCSLHLNGRVSSTAHIATYELVLIGSGLLMHTHHYAIWVTLRHKPMYVCIYMYIYNM